MTYLSLSLFLFLLVVIYAAARNDYETIIEGRKVNHVKGWLKRAGLMAYMSCLCWAIAVYGKGLNFHILLGFLLMSAGGFSAGFRAKLNSLRGKEWWYMGPFLSDRTKKDSWYDGLFHCLAWVLSGAQRWAIHGTPMYASRLPARLAYIAEIIAFAGGLYLVIKPLFQ